MGANASLAFTEAGHALIGKRFVTKQPLMLSCINENFFLRTWTDEPSCAYPGSRDSFEALLPAGTEIRVHDLWQPLLPLGAVPFIHVQFDQPSIQVLKWRAVVCSYPFPTWGPVVQGPLDLWNAQFKRLFAVLNPPTAEHHHLSLHGVKCAWDVACPEEAASTIDLFRMQESTLLCQVGTMFPNDAHTLLLRAVLQTLGAPM